MAFNKRDLVAWAKQLCEAQDVADAIDRARRELNETKSRHEDAIKKAADAQMEHGRVVADLDAARAQHAAAMENLNAERAAAQAGLEADKVARAVAQTAGQEQIRRDNAKLQNDLAAELDTLRAARDQVKDELARLRGFKADLMRDIDALAAKFGVPAK